MSLHQLYRKLIIPQSIEKVFSFFEKAENLEKITPKNLNFNIMTPTPIKMEEGALIDYKIKISGIPMKWRTLIDLYRPPFEFRDIQQKGPYKKWEHHHKFSTVDNGTLMEDTVNYELPLGILGDFVHFIKVKKQINEIFDYRNRVILDLITET